MIGKTISHYKITEKLGGGGMGVVYKAEDSKLDRTVALKFLPPHLNFDEDAEKRFISEAKAASSFDHPNICTIHDIGKTDDNQLFIVMSCYEGETLKQKLEKVHFSIEDAIDITIQIAEGLNKAHQKGIIHRDIKPANIFATNDGIAKILDFGLAKVRTQSQLTAMGTTMGTVAYMSPEQIKGEDVDHRTDIWSLGVILYEMLAGQGPFKGEYEQAIMYSVLDTAPEPLDKFNSGVPEKLQQLIDKLLNKDVNARYQNVEELLDDLRLLKDNAGSKDISVKKFVSKALSQKNSMYLIFSGIISSLAMIVLTGYWFLFRVVESQIRIPIAVVDFINETSEPELNGLSGMLVTSLEQSRHLSVLTRSRMFDILRKLGNEDFTQIDENLGREICREENISTMAIASIKKFGRIYTVDLKLVDLGKNEYLFTTSEKGEGHESIPDMIDKLAEKTRIGLKEEEEKIKATSKKVATITTPNLEAYQHYFTALEFLDNMNYLDAHHECRKAISLDSTFGLGYLGLSYTSWILYSDKQKCNEIIRKALNYIDNMPEKEQYFLRAHNAALNESNHLTLEILKEMEKIYPNDKEMLYQLGEMYFVVKDYQSSEKYLNKVLDMDPKHERSLLSLSNIYLKMKNYKAAFEIAQRHVAGNPERGTYINAQYQYEFGEHYLGSGRFDQAIIQFNKAIELDSNFANSYGSLGIAYLYQGMYQHAEKAFKKSIEIEINYSSSILYLAIVYQKQGLYVKALSHFDKAIELFKDSNIPYMYIFHFLCFQEAGKVEEAKLYISEFSKDFENDTWINAVLRYYKGEKTEQDLLNASVNIDPQIEEGQKCEAYYYLGMGYLLKIVGKRADTLKAIDSFNKCIATEVTDYVEYGLASLELNRFEGVENSRAKIK